MSMKSRTPEKSTISSNFAAISLRDIPRMAPFRKTLSRPLSSGWKPVPTSRIELTRPAISAYPSVGSVMRARIERSVDFPAPFGPITPSTSPRPTSNDTSRRAQTSSNASACAPRRLRVTIASTRSLRLVGFGCGETRKRFPRARTRMGAASDVIGEGALGGREAADAEGEDEERDEHRRRQQPVGRRRREQRPTERDDQPDERVDRLHHRL